VGKTRLVNFRQLFSSCSRFTPVVVYVGVFVSLSRQYRPFTKLAHRFNINPAFQSNSCVYIDANFKIDFEDTKNNINSCSYHLANYTVGGGNSRVRLNEMD